MAGIPRIIRVFLLLMALLSLWPALASSRDQDTTDVESQSPPPAQAGDTPALVQRYPSLHHVTEASWVRLGEVFDGLNRDAPFGVLFELERQERLFTGRGVYFAGGYLGEGLDRTEPARAPLSAVQYFLNELPRVPASEGIYAPPVVLDAYYNLVFEVGLETGVLRVVSTSPMHGHAPWQLTWDGNTYVSDSPRIGEAWEQLKKWLPMRPLQEVRDEVTRTRPRR